MASKRKISETGPSQIHLSILKYLKAEGLKESASTFTKEAKLEKANVADAVDLASLFPAAKADANKKAKVESSSSSSESSSDSDSSSSSDSESEDEKPAAKSTPVAATKMEESDSDSDSSSSSSSSSSSDSDSDSEDEKPAAKPTPAKAAPAAKAAPKKDESDDESSSSSSSSSSSDSSSDSSDDEDAPPAKVQKTETPAKPAAKPAATPKSAGGATFKAYVRGLPWAATAEELNDFFKNCGSADSEIIIGDDGRASGTALVKFSERSELDAALALDGQYWPGTERWLKIVESSDKNEGRKSFGGPVGERPEGCDTVFLGNLSWDVDEDSIRNLFKEVGEISSVRFATAEDGSFRGFGHVSFYNAEDTTKAIALAGTDVCGRPIRVDYAPPRNREAKSPGGRGGGRGRGGDAGGRGRGGGREGRGSTPRKGGFNITPTSGNKKMTFDE